MTHWDLITDRSYRIAERAIDILDGQHVEYVLGGGWAVFAYVPSVPSVDTDVFLADPLPTDVLAEFEAEGIHVGSHQEVEPLDMRERIRFWAFGDDDLGITTPGFVLRDALEHARTMPLPLGERILQVRVPSPGGLALLKLCTLHNRDLALRSFSSGEAGMHIGPARMPQIRAQSESYYLRKAGKDLYDVAALFRMKDTLAELGALVEHTDIATILPQIPHALAAATRTYAADIARSVGRPDPFTTIRDALRSLPTGSQ